MKPWKEMFLILQDYKGFRHGDIVCIEITSHCGFVIMPIFSAKKKPIWFQYPTELIKDGIIKHI